MSLPKGYKRLEYIQSSGTQYIDTGFMPNQDTRVVVDADLLSTSSIQALFGSRNGSRNGAFVLFKMSNTSFRSDYGTSLLTPTYKTATGRILIDINKEKTTLNGVSDTVAASTFQSNYSMLLFSMMDAGKVDTRMAICKLYSCQIYDNGTEVRAYVPMLHPSGVAGLWDSVNERFYASASTTDFIAGPEKVKAPKTPANFRVVSETDTEVALAWDADENATGYRLYRDGALLADLTGTEYTDTATPFGSYTYHVLGYNEHGEGDAAELVVFLSPDNPILWLVTDRTQADVTARNSKGVYRAVDLNRVGAALKYLRRRLLDAGILADVSPRMDWTDTMWMSASEARVYLNNVKAMRAALAMPKGTPAAPDDMAKLTYAEANHMEMFLVILDALLTDMVFAYRHCGTTVCGMGGLIL